MGRSTTTRALERFSVHASGLVAPFVAPYAYAKKRAREASGQDVRAQQPLAPVVERAIAGVNKRRADEAAEGFRQFKKEEERLRPLLQAAAEIVAARTHFPTIKRGGELSQLLGETVVARAVAQADLPGVPRRTGEPAADFAALESFRRARRDTGIGIDVLDRVRRRLVREHATSLGAKPSEWAEKELEKYERTRQALLQAAAEHHARLFATGTLDVKPVGLETLEARALERHARYRDNHQLAVALGLEALDVHAAQAFPDDAGAQRVLHALHKKILALDTEAALMDEKMAEILSSPEGPREGPNEGGTQDARDLAVERRLLGLWERYATEVMARRPNVHDAAELLSHQYAVLGNLNGVRAVDWAQTALNRQKKD